MSDIADAYLLLSRKWSRGPVLTWWGPNRCGYCTTIDAAGRYAEAEARAIELDSWGDAVAVKLDDALKASRVVVFADNGLAWLDHGEQVARAELARHERAGRRDAGRERP